MVRISESERKTILARYPDAWTVGTKHHTYLTGYETSYAMNYLRELRGRKPKQKATSALKNYIQPRRG